MKTNKRIELYCDYCSSDLNLSNYCAGSNLDERFCDVICYSNYREDRDRQIKFKRNEEVIASSNVHASEISWM